MTQLERIRTSKAFFIAVLIAASLILYLAPGLLMHKAVTPPDAYFDDLARAFLQGRAYIPQPASEYDLTLHDGRWYVPFPPLPALMMLPWVGIFGSLNTVLFSALVGALNVTLVFLLLDSLAQAGWSSFRTNDNLWLAVLFGFGTVHWVLSSPGNVWFMAQICAVTFAALAVWLAVGHRAPALAGAALALAMLARPNIVLMIPLILAIGLQHARSAGLPFDRRAYLLRWLIPSTLPLVLAAGGLLFYNWLRFGDLLDFGYRTANVALQLREELNEYGQFNLHYIRENLRIMLLALPEWDAARRRLAPNGLGMSLFLTTPAFLYLFAARRITPLTAGAWIATGLLLIPLITYYNPGWHQFGYRFSLDFTIPLLVWLAAGMNTRPSRLFKALIALSVLVNAWGTAWFVGLY